MTLWGHSWDQTPRLPEAKGNRRFDHDAEYRPVELDLTSLVSAASLYRLVGPGWTTAMPYGLLPVTTVAVVLKVLGSMIDRVLAPWLAT